MGAFRTLEGCPKTGTLSAYADLMENFIIESPHQTLNNQIRLSKPYTCWKELFKTCEKKRKGFKWKMPKRILGKRVPLHVFPQAIKEIIRLKENAS